MTPYNQFFAGHDGNALEIVNEVTGNFRHSAEWIYEWATGGMGKNDAGVAVNGYTALTHCPLWQGVNIIAGDIGQVPIRLVKDEFYDQSSHNAWQLLRVRPNELQSPSLFKETVIQWALIWGNAVCWTPRMGSRVTDIIPLRPDCLRPELLGFDGQQIMLYHYTSPLSGREFTFFPHDVIHIQGLTGDGVWGYPLHQVARNTIGQGLALEKHGNKQFSNGARPSGVLEHPQKLSPLARAELREDWNRIHQGSDNSGKIAILWEGMKFNATSMTNIDAQWIEAKKLNRVDCASLLNLPAHKLNALEDSSVRSNLEEQNETYKQMTLTRWANRLDEEFRRKLLTDREWKSDQYRFVFDWDAFMKADIDTLTTVVDRLVKATILNPNEGRARIGLPPRDGGEVYGSPAINPNPQPQKRPEDGKESPDNGRPSNKAEVYPKITRNSAESAHRELLYDRILHFIERESISLKQAAGGAKNFVAWLDEFYLPRGPKPTDEVAKIMVLAESLMGKSINACLVVGVDARGMAGALNAYAKKRHAQILEACSTVTKEELPAVIETLAGESTTLVAQGLLATALGEIHGTENN